MPETTKDNIRFLASLISALCLFVLILIQVWILSTVVEHGNRIERTETSLSAAYRAF